MSADTTQADYDLVVIGGGINGCGIARDAAGRGLRVLLCEQADLAGATSSASTKLIHGGLRYLEHGEFRLVRESLVERQVLLDAAPHLIRPQRFVLPHHHTLRPRWVLRLGLFLYDRLGGGQRLPPSKALRLHDGAEGRPLKDDFRHAFVYSDCTVDDARLVVLNAVDAHRRGATILTRTRFEGATPTAAGWRIALRSASSGQMREVRARALVNASGPWAAGVLEQIRPSRRGTALKLVQGSHLVVRRRWEGDHAYVFQHGDRRIVFAIPYLDRFTLIGTTDLPYEGDPRHPRITRAESDYLLALVNEYFAEPLTRDDIVADFAGVRPLYDDQQENPSAITRDYVLELDDQSGPPLLSVFGGKLTTYRVLAEQVMSRLSAPLGLDDRPWTVTATLPGGDFRGGDRTALENELAQRLDWLPPAVRIRYAQQYGTLAYDVAGLANSVAELGHDFGSGLYEAELRYLHRYEWARSADDVLWRRTKLGLSCSQAQVRAIAAWFQTQNREMAS